MRVSTLAISILMGCAVFASDPGRLLNLSNRAYIGTGDERLIGSVRAVGEPGTQVEILAVARGPSLADDLPADYTGSVLADPKLTLVDLATREETTNDNFADWNEGEIETRFPGFITDSKESGAILMLDADQAYSAIVEGVDGATGLGQIEFYEIGGSGSIAEARLGNLSNRALVGLDHERLIGSAMTTGDSPVEVLVVARGPSLADALPDYTGDVLADPKLTLVDLATREETTNDNFGNWNEGEIEIRFPGFMTDSKESGFIVELPAESTYSAIVEGVGGMTGIGQIEFYELSPTQEDIIAYGVDDLLPGVPTSGSFPSVKTGGGITIMGNEDGTTISLDNGGYFELTDGRRYTCRSLEGCTVVNGTVTAGPIAAARSEPPPIMMHPDLEVGTPSVDEASPVEGATFTLSATVSNAGDGASAATTLRYYRSSNETITTSDTEIGTDEVGALAAAGTSDQSIDLTAPSTAGTYYYGACVDAVTGESDTTDNCSESVKVDVGDSTATTHPDLDVGMPTVSDDSPATGGSFTLSATVSNSGDGASSATTLRYYRSTDVTITTSDTEVGTDSVGALAAAGTSPESISLTAPSTEGTYYYGACVDAVTGESDTTNNCSGSVRVEVEDSTPPPGTMRHPDLEVGTPTVDNDWPAMGTSFILSVTVRNAGDGTSPSTTLRYYRSTDETITTADLEVDASTLAGLNASASSAESATLPVPTTPAPGSYYFYGACVDAVTNESDTTDNCSESVMVRVSKPDLWAKFGGGDLSVELGGTFTKWTSIENSGGGASAPSTVRFLLSEDDKTVTASDTTVATVDLPSVRPGSTSGRIDGNIPAPSNPGWYHYGMCADAVPGETNTDNNCLDYGNVKVGEFVCEPDLVMAAPTVTDSSLVTRGSFTLSAAVQNSGCAYSVETTVRYFRSSDATIDTSDTEVGTDEVGQLAGTGLVYDPEGSDHSIDLNAPATPGTYYYGTCVDAVARESDTTNNCSTSVVVTVSPSTGPDLVVSSISVDDATLGPGKTFNLSGTVTNAGGTDAGVTTLRYYRSSDSTITTSDTEEDTDSVNPLASTGSSDHSISLTTPLDKGTYYYGACVDVVAGEANETAQNNCSGAVQVMVDERPDLVMSASGPAEVSPQQWFELSATVTNEGEVDVTGRRLTVRFYQSEDSTITTEDTSGGGYSYGNELAAGSSRTRTRNPMRAPSTPGTYYYGACINTVPNEWSTANNCSEAVEVTVAVYPDLRIGPFVATGYTIPLVPGGSFWLQVRLENEGDGEAAATTVRFYHSTDETITTSDTEVATATVDALAAGEIEGFSSGDLTAPSTPGSYYYGACVDAVTGETDTTNNCTKASTLEVPVPAPDLIAWVESTSDSSLDPGGSFTLSATVVNGGALAAPATTLRYYRSTSFWTLDPTTDTAVGTDSVGALASAAESEKTIALTAPLIPDDYYYYACVDTVTDENETENNCQFFHPVEVTVTAPNLEVGTPSVNDASPATGAMFTLSATVTNSGNEESAATTLRYYRSTDSTITSSDTEVGTDDVSAIASAGTSDQSIGLTAPSDTGTYYYGACVDSVTDESDTANNCSSSVQVDVE